MQISTFENTRYFLFVTSAEGWFYFNKIIYFVNDFAVV
jgi:hypothetical protein